MCEAKVLEQGTKTLRYTFSTEVRFDAPVRDHALVLRCEPYEGDGLTVVEGFVRIEPSTRIASQVDGFGNRLAVCRIGEPHGLVRYTSTGVVHLDLREQSACAVHPVFAYPSPLARMSPRMQAWAQEQGLLPNMLRAADERLMWTSLTRLSHEVSRLMKYLPGATSVSTTAAEAFEQGCGVCQDFAHVLVAFTRYVGVAARYVSGLAVGEGCTHAWVQAHVGGRWRGLDPTRCAAVDETYLPLAVGRDWSDCPVERGCFVGLVQQSQSVHMEVHEE